jgi:hypothetical protein
MNQKQWGRTKCYVELFREFGNLYSEEWDDAERVVLSQLFYAELGVYPDDCLPARVIEYWPYETSGGGTEHMPENPQYSPGYQRDFSPEMPFTAKMLSGEWNAKREREMKREFHGLSAQPKPDPEPKRLQRKPIKRTDSQYRRAKRIAASLAASRKRLQKMRAKAAE